MARNYENDDDLSSVLAGLSIRNRGSKRLMNAFDRATSKSRLSKYKELLNKLIEDTSSPEREVFIDKKLNDNAVNIKDVLKCLQYICYLNREIDNLKLIFDKDKKIDFTIKRDATQLKVLDHGVMVPYKTLTQYLDNTDKEILKYRAELILKYLNGKNDEKIEETICINNKSITVFSRDSLYCAYELIVFTQIADAVPPTKNFIKELKRIRSENQLNSIGYTSGRVPGSDKYARAALKYVRDGKYRFSDIFGGENALYVPSRNGGVHKTRLMLIGILEFNANDILNEMSSSSGDDDDNNL